MVRIRRIAIWVAIVLLFASGLVSTPVDATDSASTGFDTDPARCTTEPHTLADLERIVSTATPIPVPKRPSSGESIDPASANGKTAIALIEQLFSCLNAGDRLRAYALYTDAYLARVLRSEDLPVVATPWPLDDDEYTRIIAIELHHTADDGMIVKVVLDPALIPVHKIFEFILVPVEDSWRIDAVIDEINFSLP